MKSYASLFLMVALAASTAPANLIVTNTADNGPGSLRDALAATANGDTIDATGISGTILLTTGELLVTNSVTILGPGPASLALNGNAASRVLHVGSNAIVSISGMTITNGSAVGPSFPADYFGGGILNEQATLTLSNCAVTGNEGFDSVMNNGANGNARLTMVKCIVSGNPELAIFNFGSLSNVAVLTIVSSAISNNFQGFRGCGVDSLASDNGVAMLTISNCIISGNSAGLDGGGILNFGELGGSAYADIQCSSINGNSANDNGGGIANVASSGSATMTINNSTLSGNSTTSTGGGGIANTGDQGTATLVIVNSTLSSNSVYLGETGGDQIGAGGGILNITRNSGIAALHVFNTTLSGNSGGVFGGAGNIANGGPSGSAGTELGSCILNSDGLSANLANAGSGTVTSDGYNLSSDTGGGFLTHPTDLTNTGPMLGPLQDNGGPTFTHALLRGSPAIDKGKNFGASATDQRGRPRTYENRAIPNAIGADGTDIGAFEFIPPILSIAPNFGNVALFWSTNDPGYTVEFTSVLPNSGSWTTVPGTPLVIGNQYLLGDGPVIGNKFYRLRNP